MSHVRVGNVNQSSPNLDKQRFRDKPDGWTDGWFLSILYRNLLLFAKLVLV